MKTYGSNQIRNVAVAGHAGAGKSSLVEALLYYAGALDRLGKSAEGTLFSDFDVEEVKRKASLNLTLLPLEYEDCKINLLDTPGLFDFAAGMVEGVCAADSVLIVISGKSGITVGAKKAYCLAKKLGKPILIFVSKLDAENADFYRVLEELKATFGPAVCPVVAPYYQDNQVKSLIDLIDMKAYTYNEKGEQTSAELPPLEHRLEGLTEAIGEAVAETDEALFEKFFSGQPFTREEMVSGVHAGVKAGDITPVICGAPQSGIGIELVFEAIRTLLPSPVEAKHQIPCDENGPLCATVFQTIVDPYLGKLSFVRVLSGKLSPDSTPKNSRTGQIERVGKLLYLCGKKQEDTKTIFAGDIGAVAKMEWMTGDMLCQGCNVEPSNAPYPNPCYSRAVETRDKGDESKISSAISKLLQEDLSLRYQMNAETKQQILSGLGEQHLDVAVAKLKNKFGVDVILTPERIPYRETIRKKVKVEGRHKKQTGGHGQFGHVWIEFEPISGEEIEFEEKIFGGAVPKGYFPAVEKGVRESATRGVLAGYPMVGLKATLVDGSYHPVDSSEMAFKMAAGIAYREGVAQAEPILLEPVGTLHVIVPDGNTGDMMGELNKRRGRVAGMNPSEEEAGYTVIEAEVPMAQMQDFSLLVRQMTQGAGSYRFEFTRYEQMPGPLQEKIIEQAKG